MIYAELGWKWPSGSWEDFKNLSMYFRNFIIISSWKRVGPFIWRNLNPLHIRILCAKFGWNWPTGSGVRDENVKSLRQQWRREQRQRRQQTNRKARLSFRLRWTKKQFDIDLWPCDLNINRGNLLARGIHCTKLRNFLQAKGSRDIEKTSFF